MADTEHSKCFARKGVRVQVPLPALRQTASDLRRYLPRSSHRPEGCGPLCSFFRLRIVVGSRSSSALRTVTLAVKVRRAQEGVQNVLVGHRSVIYDALRVVQVEGRTLGADPWDRLKVVSRRWAGRSPLQRRPVA